jgi:hypothetical protein
MIASGPGDGARFRVFLTTWRIYPMPTSLNVNKLSASAKTSFLSPQDRTRAEGGTTRVIIGLLIAVGLVSFAVGNIYLNYLVGPTDLPFLGQFIGS